MTRAVDPSPSTLNVLSSEELACRAQAGSLPCFAELVHRHQGRLYNFLLRRIGNDNDTEDLTQETFLRAWQRIDQFKPKWRFSTWLYTIGSRLAINHYRSASRRRQVELSGVATDGMTAGDADPMQMHEQAESVRSIWDVAMQLLNPEQHAMVWLRYAEDLSSAEIARVMGKTQVAVRVSLHRARERIAAAMKTDDTRLSVGRHDTADTPFASEAVTGGVY